MRLRRALVLACAVAALAAPAARAAAGPGAGLVRPGEQRWLLIVEQLSAAVTDAGRAASQTSGSIESSRALLVNSQALFESAVAYGVFSGCSQTLRDAGRPTSRLRAIRDSIDAACRPLVLASDAFLGAIRSKQPKALVAAERQAATGVKLMERAAARLAGFRKSHR